MSWVMEFWQSQPSVCWRCCSSVFGRNNSKIENKELPYYSWQLLSLFVVWMAPSDHEIFAMPNSVLRGMHKRRFRAAVITAYGSVFVAIAITISV